MKMSFVARGGQIFVFFKHVKHRLNKCEALLGVLFIQLLNNHQFIRVKFELAFLIINANEKYLMEWQRLKIKEGAA